MNYKHYTMELRETVMRKAERATGWRFGYYGTAQEKGR